MNPSAPVDRHQTLGEEIANSVSHGVAFLGAVAVTPLLIINAIDYGAASVVAVSVFGATMMLLYLSSTLYHAFPHSRTKRVFNIFDHAGIFLLIAGTYTPFTLGVLEGPWGWSLFGVLWTLAILGVVIKSVAGARSGKWSTTLYLAMGWIAVIAAKPFWENIQASGLIWLLAGGIMYSAGVLFFIAQKIKYSHFIWHLFVIAGNACHVVAVWKYSN